MTLVPSKGRGRLFSFGNHQQQGAPLPGVGRGSSVFRANPFGQPSHAQQQRERRSSDRQVDGVHVEAPSASSGAGVTGNAQAGFRFVTDSSDDDDVADAIVFNTFLPSNRPN